MQGAGSRGLPAPFLINTTSIFTLALGIVNVLSVNVNTLPFSSVTLITLNT